jgi:hypothetical protein
MEIYDDVHQKPLKILTETNEIKAEKILAYIKSNTINNNKWKYFDTIISDINAFSIIKNPTFVIIKSNDVAILEKWKHNLIKNKNVIIFTTIMHVKAIRNKFKGYNIQLLLTLHKRHNSNNEINESNDVDVIIPKIAEILNYKKIITSETEIPKIYLIQQFFNAPDATRANEFNMCLKMNANCELIDKIILLNESDNVKLPTIHSKIQCVNLGRRMNYYDVFKYIKEEVPLGVITLFANTDIFLMNDFNAIYNINMSNKFLALLRWDVNESGMTKIFGPRNNSQDTWGILSDDAKEMNLDNLNFMFGKPGCDNAITAIMKTKGFMCINPAFSLKSYHVHNTNIRNYTNMDRVYNPEYLFLNPTNIT